MSTPVPDIGFAIFDYLRGQLNEYIDYQDMLAALKLEDSDRTRRAYKWARKYAEDAGLYIPDRAGATQYNCICTDHAEPVFDPALVAHRQAAGRRKSAEKHDQFMKSAKMQGLTAAEKRFVNSRIRFRQKIEELADEADEQALAVIALRREMRQSQAV